MKARHGLAIASLVPLLTLGAGAAQGASATAPETARPAAQSHTVTVSGTMELNDDETFGDEHDVRRMNGSARLTHSSPEQAIFFKECLGGEVRGELWVNLRLRANNQVTVSPTLYLYEGTSCGTTDLDGRRSGTPTNVSPGRQLRWTNLKATNMAERTPDDYASTSFTVTHTAR